MKAENSNFDSIKEKYSGDGFLFRGQENSSWGLISSFDRKYTNHRESFDFYFKTSTKLAKNLKANFSFVFPYDKDDYWKNYTFYNFVQHYDYPTPFLDWSSKLEVALFFSKNSKAIDCTPTIYILNTQVMKTILKVRLDEGSYFDEDGKMRLFDVGGATNDTRVRNQGSFMSITTHVEIENYLVNLEKIGRKYDLLNVDDFVLKKIILDDDLNGINRKLLDGNITPEFIYPTKHFHDISNICREGRMELENRFKY